jgi:hypothetical protein
MAASRTPELLGLLDHLQYRERVESVRTLAQDIRTKGVVPAVLAAGARFGLANRALLGV